MLKTNEYIIVHHSAVSRGKNKEQFDAIDGYHKRLGWGGIGYHYLIEPDGTVKDGRPENKVGAHCRQQFMNYRSIGICLAGHFDIEDPTKEQKNALLQLLNELQAKYGITDAKVRLHREYATYKSCPGKRIPNDIRGYIDLDDLVPEWGKEAWEWAKKKKIISDKSEFSSPLTKGEMIVLLHRALN